MQRSLIAMLTTVVFTLGALSVAHAGLIVKQETRDTGTHKTVQEVSYFDGNRMASHSSDGTGAIYDGDRQVIWTYDTRHKIYTKTTAAQMKAMAAKAKAMGDKMMREEMKNMSPKMRKQVEAEMKKPKKGPTYKRMGTMRTVGKWRCTPVAKFDADGYKVDSMCIATYKELGITSDDRKVFKSLNDFEASFAGDDDSSASSGSLPERVQKQLGLQGLPVEDSDNNHISTTTSVRHGHISASVFQLPKGLKEQKMFGR